MSSPKKPSPAKISEIVWKVYLAELSKGWHGRRMSALEANLCVYGLLSDELHEPLGDALRRVQRTKVCIDDCAPTAVQASWKPAEIEQLNACNDYLIFDARTRWALMTVLAAMKKQLGNVLACPFRVLNVRSYVTNPGATGGPFEWHSDGEAEELLKIMIYLTATDNGGGGLEVDTGGDTSKELQGPAGMWVMLYNSKLRHRAVAPKQGERLAMEITISPWCHYELEPVSFGLNARHPMFPVGV